MAPDQAQAQCAVAGAGVQCGNTVTTNTRFPDGQPNDRFVQTGAAVPISVVVQGGVIVSGHGLAVQNDINGGIAVVNDGVISVDAGATPTAGGTAALSLTSAGGVISYTGGAIANNGAGNGLDVVQTGAGRVDISLTGDVLAANGGGVTVGDTGGAGVLVATGNVTALAGDAIVVVSDSDTADIAVVANGDLRATGAGVLVANTSLLATGDVSVTTNGSIEARAGIVAANNGSGSLTVTAAGPIFATIRGIDARAVSGDLTVTTGDVTAGEIAILASQAGFGPGAVDVSVGTVSGTFGIVATNDSSGAININARGAVTGTGGDGVRALGEGAVSITAADTVTGGVNGLSLFGGSGGAGDISVTGAGGFVGRAGDAVNILNNGSGSVLFDVSGPITATNGSGVFIRDTAAGGDISVTTGAVTAPDVNKNAIDVLSVSDTADIAVVANGDLRASRGGVLAQSSSLLATGDLSVTTNGSIEAAFGIFAQNSGSGPVTVTAAGPIVGTEFEGIRVESSGGDVTVAAGDVTAAGSAILARQTGPGPGAIDVSAGTVSGAGGISAINDGSGAININARGAVTAKGGEGIGALGQSAVSITIADTVTGGVRGLSLVGGSGGAGDISVTGAGGFVSQNGDAVNIFNGGAGSVLFDVAGPITATNGNGVFIRDTAVGGDISVTTGAVTATTGTFNAINVFTGSLTADLNIVANGVLKAGNWGVFSRVLSAGASGDMAVATNAAIEAGQGIQALNFGSGSVGIVAAGPITATTGRGVQAQTAGGAIDITTGAVTAANVGIQALHAGAGTGAITVVANGAVNSATSDGVLLQGNGAVDFTGAGLVSGVRGLSLVGGSGGSGDISVTGAGGFVGLAGDAVNILNAGSGSVVFDVSGPITATGGNGVVVRDTPAGGDISVTTGAVTATDDNKAAIDILSRSGTGDITVVANGDLRGGIAGVSALLGGAGAATGDINVTTNGSIAGVFGISALNQRDGSVTVNAVGPIAADGFGVSAQTNLGNITVNTGDVTASGGGGAGILLFSNGSGSIDLTTGNISGAAGIIATGFGDGAVAIATNGAVTGTSFLNDAIRVTGNRAVSVAVADRVSGGRNGLSLTGGTGGAGDISVTGAGGFVGRAGDAVNILNNGSGSVLFDVSGPITATNGNGVFIRDTAVGGDISVTTGAVTATTGTFNAINVFTGSLTADLNIVANGVLKAGNWGVFSRVLSAGASGDMAVATDAAIEAGQGIQALNFGSGSVGIVAAGPITATTGRGVQAQTAGGAIDITTGAVTSNNVGIQALQTGVGAGRVAITANGAVTSATAQGILANGGDIQIDVRDVKGATIGVSTNNSGPGATDIRVRGTVEGATSAINAFSGADQDVTILNEGVIRNSSGASFATALSASGGLVSLTNAGTLLGGVILDADSSGFVNRGSWNSIFGDSFFAGGDDQLTNAAGGLILGNSGADVLDLTLWRGLETFENSGRIALSDGGAGDVVITSANTLFLDGSVLEVDIGGENDSDVFVTSGTLDIQAGSRLVVNTVQPLALNFRYVVASADGGLTGRFEFEDRLLTAFVGLRDGYTDNTAFIEVAQLRALAEAALTANQRETAEGADSLPDTSSLKTALLLLPDDEAAIDAFDQLSGEVHPAARRAMADDSRLTRDAILDRVSENGPAGLWGQAFLEERVTDADDNAASTDRDARGVLFGADRALGDTLVVGVAASRFDTRFDIDDRKSTGSIRTTEGMAYVGGQFGSWGLTAGVGYAVTATHTERQIVFPGVSASAEARYDGSVLQGFLDAGFRIPLQSVSLEPFANLTTIRAETDAFSEIGGTGSLAGEANTDDLTISTLGLRFGTGRIGGLSLWGSAGWRNVSGDRDPDGRHAFGGGSTFTVLGALQSEQAVVMDLEAQWRLAPNVTLGVAYDGIMGTEGQDHAVRGSFRLTF